VRIKRHGNGKPECASPLPFEEQLGTELRKTLLIVDDNTKLRHFPAKQFESKFNVLQAADGKQVSTKIPPRILSIELRITEKPDGFF
jgi:hypothetical protein